MNKLDQIKKFNIALSENNYVECNNIIDSLNEEEAGSLLYATYNEVGILTIIFLIQRALMFNKPIDLLDAAHMLNVTISHVEGAEESSLYLMKLYSDLVPNDIEIKESILDARIRFDSEYIKGLIQNTADEILLIQPSHKEARFVKYLIKNNLPLRTRVPDDFIV